MIRHEKERESGRFSHPGEFKSNVLVQHNNQNNERPYVQYDQNAPQIYAQNNQV